MRPQIRLIACSVFRPALEHLRLGDRYHNLSSTFLLSNLHLKPYELRNVLLAEIRSAKTKDERVICLYGCCVPDMDDFCRRHGVIRTPGFHCFEMLLGSQRYQQIINEIPGTYFLERELILNFAEYCSEPLELDDKEMRRLLFERYERLLYVRQPSDPDLLSRARELAEFLHLTLEIRDADYRHFDRILTDLI